MAINFFKKEKLENLKTKEHKNVQMIKALAPNGIVIERDHIIIENFYMRFFTIVNYPDYASIKWLSTLNMQGISWSFHVDDVDLDKLISQTNNSIKSKEHQLERTRDPIVKQRLFSDISNATVMLKKMDSKIEKTVDFSIIIRVVGHNLEDLEDNSVRLKTRCASNKIPVKPITFAQEQSLLKNMPLNLDIPLRYSNPMPISNIMIGYPFLNNYINDDQGNILGYDEYFNDVVINFWNKNQQRTNSNVVVIGDSGAGKTMLTKDILYQEYITGSKIAVIDIEREYTKLARKFDGDIINMAGGKYTMNPFEIFLEYSMNGTDDDEVTSVQVPPLSVHIKHIEKWLNCYANFDDYQLSTISSTLYSFYESKGMNIDMDLAKLKQFPQFFIKDYYKYLVDLKKVEEDDFKKNLLNQIETIIQPISVGADAHIWNNISNFPQLKKFTVFDIFELRNLDTRILTSQYYLLMERLWHECVINRMKNKNLPSDKHTFLRIVCDELHKILSTKIIATEFKNLSKMIRKYDGGLMTITQATTDYLRDDLVEEGKAILSSAVYKFVFAQNTQGLIDSKRVFDLNDKEVELLASATQSNCLAIFGNYKTKLVNVIPDFILKEIS